MLRPAPPPTLRGAVVAGVLVGGLSLPGVALADQQDVAVSTNPSEAPADIAAAGLTYDRSSGTVQGQAGPPATNGVGPIGLGSLLSTTSTGGVNVVGWNNDFAGASVQAFLTEPDCDGDGGIITDDSDLKRDRLDDECERPSLTYRTRTDIGTAPAPLPKLLLRVEVPTRDELFAADAADRAERIEELPSTTTEYWAYDPLDDDEQQSAAVGEWQEWDTRDGDSSETPINGGWRRYDNDGAPRSWGTSQEEVTGPAALNIPTILQFTGGRYFEATFGSFPGGTSLQIVSGSVKDAITGDPAGGAPATKASVDAVESAVPESFPFIISLRRATNRTAAFPAAPLQTLNFEPRRGTTPARPPSRPSNPSNPGTTPPSTTAGSPDAPQPAPFTPTGKAPSSGTAGSTDSGTCRSRRSFTIRLRKTAKGPLTGLRATVNGRRAKVRRRSDGRYVVRVSVRGREGRTRFVVRLRATTANGRRLRATRVYRPCRTKPLGPLNNASALSLTFTAK